MVQCSPHARPAHANCGFVVQHMPSVLGVVGKGSPSCPGKKKKKGTSISKSLSLDKVNNVSWAHGTGYGY